LLKRKQGAVGLAELLTDPAKKIRALLQVAKQLREQSDQEKEWLALLLRAGEIARTLENSDERALFPSDERVQALAALASALTQAQAVGPGSSCHRHTRGPLLASAGISGAGKLPWPRRSSGTRLKPSSTRYSTAFWRAMGASGPG